MSFIDFPFHLLRGQATFPPWFPCHVPSFSSHLSGHSVSVVCKGFSLWAFRGTLSPKSHTLPSSVFTWCKGGPGRGESGDLPSLKGGWRAGGNELKRFRSRRLTGSWWGKRTQKIPCRAVSRTTNCGDPSSTILLFLKLLFF